jgi:TRAP-type C4-dicarboxylate transport system substrate-binding protein
MPIGFQIALNAYAMNLNTWKKLTPEQQGKLTAAFQKLEEDTWSYSKELFADAVRCNVGKDPCTTVKKFKMTEVPVKEADLKMVQDAISTVSFPAWSEVCNKSYPGCGETWKKLIGPIAGVK